MVYSQQDSLHIASLENIYEKKKLSKKRGKRDNVHINYYPITILLEPSHKAMTEARAAAMNDSLIIKLKKKKK